MSIIHDALKKAEEARSAKKDGDGNDLNIPTYKPTASNKKSLNPRKIIVPTFLIVCLLGVYIFGKDHIAKLLSGSSNKNNVVKLDASQFQPKPITQEETPKQEKAEIKKEQEAKKTKDLQDEFFAAYEKENYKQALMVMEELIHLMPTEAQVYNNYGLVLKKLDREQDAMTAYQKALALNPNYPEALNNLGAVYLSKRRYAKAKELFQRAIEGDSEYLDPYFHLAIAYEKNDELEKAKQFYRDFLKRSEGLVDRRVRLQVEERLNNLAEL